ncbi:MAG: competence protein ComEC [Halomonadaceae bacterium T82-2]|nr:MAG: competence protein ComEC [Halomonadaceae bacterium T82-2]
MSFPRFPAPSLAVGLALAAVSGSLAGWWAPPGLPGFLAVAVLLGLAAGRYRLVVLLLVMGLTALAIGEARQARLPEGLSRQDLRVTATITQWQRDGSLARLRLAVSDCRPLAAVRPDCRRLERVRVSWYDPPALATGDVWSLTLRLRPPAGFANPHTFDYGAWLWREGIGATGYVRDAPPPRRLVAGRPGVREAALAHLDQRVADPLTRRWLGALTLGASERLTEADWDLLNATGTTHVMVISGLHVGLVATLMLWLARGVARLVMPARWRLAVWPWWAAALAAVGYGWLAGLEPPTLRAIIMTLIGLWVASGRHAPGPWQGWWLALALVVAIDPLSLWRPGLWLSFTAVALLILAWQGRRRPAGRRGWCLALLRTQLLLSPLMAAAVLLAFGRLAPAAPLVNLLIVPLVGSLLVPLGLAGWMAAPVPPLASLCWQGFGWLAHGLHAALVATAGAVPLWEPPGWAIWPTALALILITLLWGLPGVTAVPRWLGSLTLAVLVVTLAPPDMAKGRLRLRVQDVGQGQLVELRTAHHRLLYDTGPRFRSGFMPLSTLWPAGQHFDAVIVSHGDRDHAGGVPELVARHAVARWYSPLADRPSTAGEDAERRRCRAGRGWRWDGVRFRFLWPRGTPPEKPRNDRSCVLLVTAANGEQALISGDATTAVETRLLDTVPRNVTVLVAGHHGSATSSSPAWVATTRPRQVVFSAGRDNPHGHPRPAVVRRYRRAGSCLWNTALDGAVTLWLGGGPAPAVTTRRALPGGGESVGGDCHAIESPH